MRIHEGPHFIGADALHEEVGGPQAEEEVTRAAFVFTGVALEVEPVKNIGVPWLKVNGKGAFALTAALVDVGGRGVKVAQHGHEAVGGATGAVNGRASCTNIVYVQTNAAGHL